MSRKPRRYLAFNPNVGKQLILLLHQLLAFSLLAFALWPTCWLLLALQPRVHSASGWTLLILAAILVFNFAWLMGLLGLRLMIPYTKEGFYPRGKDGRPPREAMVFMLNVLLLKLRAHAPWAGMFSSVLVNLPPLHGLYSRFFGPKTTSVTIGDASKMLDPYLVKAGDNVQFGFDSLIACHLFDHRGLYVKGVEIGDHVIIGGSAIITPGVRIGEHSIVATRAFVGPNTIIGPYEYWAGNPAEKVKDLPRPVESGRVAAPPSAELQPSAAEFLDSATGP